MKKKILSEKERLEKELNAIIEKEHTTLIDKAYPSFKKFEGKYFKYRNSYGSDGRKWWKYKMVVSVTKDNLYVINSKSGGTVLSHCTVKTFQTDSGGVSSFTISSQDHTHNLGTPITKAEWDKALRAFKSQGL